MDELVEWLRRVLREDELAVFAAMRDDADNLWKHQCDRDHRNYLIRFADPKTVLADIEAKRAVLDLLDLTAGPHDPATGVLREAIRTLARAYRHRPGWRAEWE